jgi:uncharacterized protein
MSGKNASPDNIDGLTGPGDERRFEKMYEPRDYRTPLHVEGLVSFTVTVKETDLFVLAQQNLEEITRDLVLKHRGYLENYIARFQTFATTLVPWPLTGPFPLVVNDMVSAGNAAGVGPMAAVAGAIAERVGLDLLPYSDEVVIENGGDIFIKTNEPVSVGILAGQSPLSHQVGLRIDSTRKPMGVCTSSGTVGHSLSFGKADAVCVVSGSCALADAAATAIGNHVQSNKDISAGIEIGRKICGVEGIVIIKDDRIGAWGALELIPLRGKKG